MDTTPLTRTGLTGADTDISRRAVTVVNSNDAVMMKALAVVVVQNDPVNDVMMGEVAIMDPVMAIGNSINAGDTCMALSQFNYSPVTIPLTILFNIKRLMLARVAS